MTNDIPVTVIQKVAGEEGTKEANLPPIGEAVDPDALDAIISQSTGDVSVSFDYAGHDVFVKSDVVQVE